MHVPNVTGKDTDARSPFYPSGYETMHNSDQLNGTRSKQVFFYFLFFLTEIVLKKLRVCPYVLIRLGYGLGCLGWLNQAALTASYLTQRMTANVKVSVRYLIVVTLIP